MSNFNIGLQEATGGYRVVLYSRDNGKLVLAGEVIKAMQDAMDTEEALIDAWNSKANRVERTDAIIPKGHKWPKNAGPKKKAAIQSAIDSQRKLNAAVSDMMWRAAKKAAKKAPAKKAGHVANPIHVKTKKPVKLGYMPGVGYVTSKKAKKK